MSGILGIWNRDGRPVDRAEAQRLQALLAHRGRDDEGLAIEGCAALACCLGRITPESVTETQPVTGRSGASLVFDGRLDNREELLELLGRRPAAAASTPDALVALEAFEAFGDRFLEKLIGDFAIGVFDPRRQAMLLARDAVGVRPLYYHATPTLLLFASEIKALVAHSRVTAEPHADLLAELLFSPLAGRDERGSTLFRNILTVLPGQVVTVTPRTLDARPYWDFDPGRRFNIASIDEASEIFRYTFERAVRRRLRSAGPVAVSVSGGLDSSAIFAVAQSIRRTGGLATPVLGMSYTFPDGVPADEKTYLRDLELVYGEKIVRFDDLSPGIMAHSREGIWHAEAPQLDSHGNRMHDYLGRVRGCGARVLLTGHWGDQFLSDDAYLVDLCSRGRWRKARRHLTESARWLDLDDRGYLRRRLARGLLRHWAPSSFVSLLRGARNRVRTVPATSSWYVETFRHRAAGGLLAPMPRSRIGSAHAQSMYRAARCQYHAFAMEWNNKSAACHGLEMAFPFLDRDLIALLMALPGEMVAWQGVPKGLLRRSLSGVLPESIACRASKADFTSLVNETMAVDHQRLVDCLVEGQAAVAFGFVRPEGLSEAAQARPSATLETSTLSWALKDLLSLELWLQQFFGSNNRQAPTEAA